MKLFGRVSASPDTDLLKAEKELASVNRELAWELSKAAVDVVGIADPTPVSDTVSLGMSLIDGDLIGAGLSLVSIVPYAGDALAKTAKGARAAKKIAKLQKRIAALATKIRLLRGAKPTRAAIKKTVHTTKRLPKGSSFCFPCMLKEIRRREARKIGGKKNFVGGIRKGVRVLKLKGVKSKPIKFVKQDPAMAEQMRKQFNHYRGTFMKKLSGDPKKVEQLKRAGLSEKDIKKMRQGLVPNGWEVHHKHPLDGGGLNAEGNLVLIPKEVHYTFTNEQRRLFGKLEPGESVTKKFPMPDGFVYPPTPNRVIRLNLLKRW